MRSYFNKSNIYHVAYDIGFRNHNRHVAKLKRMARKQTRLKIKREDYKQVHELLT